MPVEIFLVHLVVVVQLDQWLHQYYQHQLFNQLPQVLSIHNRPLVVHVVDQFYQGHQLPINHSDHEYILKVLY